MSRSKIKIVMWHYTLSQNWPLGRAILKHFLNISDNLWPDVHSWVETKRKGFEDPFVSIEECRRHWLDRDTWQVGSNPPFTYPSKFFLFRNKYPKYKFEFVHSHVSYQNVYLPGRLEIQSSTTPPIDWVPLFLGFCKLLKPFEAHIDPQVDVERSIIGGGPVDEVTGRQDEFLRRLPWVYSARPKGPTPLPVAALRKSGFKVHKAGGLDVLQLTEDVLDYKKRPEYFAERKALAMSLLPEAYFTEPYVGTPPPPVPGAAS